MKSASNFIRALCRSSIESKHKQGSLELEGEVDILTVAMKSGGFSDEDLVDQMMTFLAAGWWFLSFFQFQALLDPSGPQLLHGCDGRCPSIDGCS